ncbi:MAG: MaoC/PaaZ C-terminal domain-containing protein [Pseudomonadota bacterium]
MDKQASVERRITAEEVAAYARLTGDFNPIHLDDAFAAGTPFGKRILHGTLTLTLLWRAFAALTPDRDLTGSQVSLRFTAPVGVGERAAAAAGPADEPGCLEGQVTNEAGKVAIRATLHLPNGKAA